MVSLSFSFRASLLSFLPLGPLARSGYSVCPQLRSFLAPLVALSVFCLRCSFFLLSRFSGYLARPAFVSPCFHSLSYAASSTSSALSSSSTPLRRGLLVCLQLQLRRQLGVLLPCPLLWLLPLRLPSGFHLLLTFCGAVLLAWFRWGPVVPAHLII